MKKVNKTYIFKEFRDVKIMALYFDFIASMTLE